MEILLWFFIVVLWCFVALDKDKIKQMFDKHNKQQ